jgi:hypothetical protein
MGMIDEAVQANAEIVLGYHFQTLQVLLNDAETDEEFLADNREMLAMLGRHMKERAAFRVAMKKSKGWDGHKTAWKALEAYIAKNDTGKPWWKILVYADGGDVSEEVAKFFE